MIILHAPRLDEYAAQHADAASALSAWLNVAQHAQWRNLMEVRQTYAHADAVKLPSGRIVTVFNIKGNRYRLLTAIDYPMAVVNILGFLTHAEYAKEKWKVIL
jgi:mRNA interferase HigB